MRIVRSNQLYSPQIFVERLTDRLYIFQGDDDVITIHRLLKENGVETDDAPLKDYALDEIEKAIEEHKPVVLVEALRLDEHTHDFVEELRWFEVPKDFED